MLEAYDCQTDRWTVVADRIPGVTASMNMLNSSGRLLFYGIDRQQAGQAQFVLFDPTPTAVPAASEPLSLRGRTRGERQVLDLIAAFERQQEVDQPTGDGAAESADASAADVSAAAAEAAAVVQEADAARGE